MEMRVVILLCLFGLFIDAAKCNETPVDICSGADISGENLSDMDDIADRFWYYHFIVDPDNIYDLDGKLMYTYGSKGMNTFAYQVGRDAQTGKCRTFVFHDSQVIRRRPCLISTQLYPPSNGGLYEAVYLISKDKTQLIYYYCGDYDRQRQRCKHDKVTAAFATTRKHALPGEREKFEAKLKKFSGFVPRIRVERPTANDCEDSVLRGLGRLPNRKTAYGKNRYPLFAGL